MYRFHPYFLLLLFPALAGAQLTPAQKLFDFQQLAATYDKQYGLYEWKKEAVHFDLLDIAPWLDRVRQSQSDLDFYEICVAYVAGLEDAHDSFTLPSGFSATLGFGIDLYDAKPLIDTISRTLLPASRFPFQIGDEVLAVDGASVEELIRGYIKYSIASNPRSARRSAAGRITTRSQFIMPHAHEIGDSATVLIRRQSGNLETYTIPWNKSGIPILKVGPVPTLPADRKMAAQRPAEATDGLEPLLELQNDAVPAGNYTNVLGVGSIAPVFGLPARFSQRLGRNNFDDFFSGTFPSGDKTIGFLRIPSFVPRLSSATAEQSLAAEIRFMQENTDGLIVDDMRNPGGLIAWQNTVCQYLIPHPFEVTGWSMRATASRVRSFAANVTTARLTNQPQWVVDLYQFLFEAVQEAYNENRGMTGPVPLDGVSLTRQPAVDRSGAIIAYSKPLIVLVDEFSISGGDQFPAVMQDAGRGPIVGYRTMGAGGTNGSLAATTYSEGTAGLTFGIAVRPNAVATPDFGVTQYTENVGVRPDIEIDYMTAENLLNNGRPFFDAVTAVIVDQINKGAR